MKAYFSNLAILPLFFSVSAYATTDQEFCESYVSLTAEVTAVEPVSIGAMLKLMILPRQAIKSQKIESSRKKEGVIDAGSIEQKTKMILVNLKNEPQDLAQLKVKFKQLSSMKKKVNQLDLIRELRSVETVEACLGLLEKHPSDYASIKEYLEFHQSVSPALEKQKETQAVESLHRKLKAFKKQGWKIVHPKDLFEMIRIIETTPSLGEVMVISHSDQTGNLYDAERNILPAGMFSNLPSTVRKLMVFSCNAENVIKRYQFDLEAAKGRYDYFYPEVSESLKNIFDQKTPLVAVRGMLPAAREKSESVAPVSRKCIIEISHHINNGYLLVTLNDRLLGSLSSSSDTRHEFFCDLMDPKKNLVKVFYLGSSERSPIGVSSIELSDELGKKHRLDVKEFLSVNSERHILTIGK